MSVKLSIITPVYNVEKYLVKCIESILNQSFKDFELILINDGSTDSSGEICERYANQDVRVKVIHKENGGQSSARNIGIRVSEGKYIGFIDADDWIEQDMFQLLYELSVRSGADISVIGIREVSEKEEVLSEYLPGELDLTEIFKRAYPCNKLFKRDLFINNNLFFIEGRYYEDVELIPKLFVKSKQRSVVKKIGYNYLKRVNSTTSSRDKKILDNLWAYTSFLEFIQKEDLYISYKSEFETGVEYFKKYFINILYDFPTSFILKNWKEIINNFNKIGGVKISEYIRFSRKHIDVSLRRTVLKILKRFVHSSNKLLKIN